MFLFLTVIALVVVTRHISTAQHAGMLLFLIINFYNILLQFPLMFFFLAFSILWALILCVWAVSLIKCLKIVYYRIRGVVVEVKYHERRVARRNVLLTDSNGENQNEYQWIGDFEVPFIQKHDTPPGKVISKKEETEEVCYEVQKVRKLFIVPIDLYNENTLEAYVLPRRLQNAMPVRQADTELKECTFLSVFSSVFILGFGVPGVIIPVLTFTAAGGDLDMDCSEWECFCWQVAVSYFSIMGSSILIYVYCLRQHCSTSASEETTAISTGELELTEVDNGIITKYDDDMTLATVESSTVSTVSTENKGGNLLRH